VDPHSAERRLKIMSEWITVRIAKADKMLHPNSDTMSMKLWRSWFGTTIRVKRIKLKNDASFRRMGCNSTKFYLVKPDDSKRIRNDDRKRYVCEHYIELL
jgi:hypothetical protein